MKKHNERGAGRKTIGTEKRKPVQINFDTEILEQLRLTGNMSATVNKALKLYFGG